MKQVQEAGTRRRAAPHHLTGCKHRQGDGLWGSSSKASQMQTVIGKMRQLPQHRVADYESKSLKVLNYW